MPSRLVTRLAETLAPWIPIAMLVASTAVAFTLRGRESGLGLSALAWFTVALAVGLASTRWPASALTGLVFLIPITPYFRYDTWLGQALPLVIAAPLLVGVALNSKTAWSRLLRDRRRSVATAVLTFSALLSVSVVLVLLQRGSFLISALGREDVGGFFNTGWAVKPQNSFPIDRSGSLIVRGQRLD